MTVCKSSSCSRSSDSLARLLMISRYRILSYGIKLEPPNSWHTTFTLSRLLDQPPIEIALAYPMADQLDDWRDYQRLKNVDRGEDFDVLRDILGGTPLDSKPESLDEYVGGEGMQRGDSGYFSRRSSRMPSRVNSMPLDFLEGTPHDSTPELDFKLVAEGTPSTPDSGSYNVDSEHPDHGLFSPRSKETILDLSAKTHSANLRREQGVITNSMLKKSNETLRDPDEKSSRRSKASKDWRYHHGTWRGGSLGLDGVEQDEPVQWACKRGREGAMQADVRPDGKFRELNLESAPESEDLGDRQAAALMQMKRWTFRRRDSDAKLMRKAVSDGAADTVEAGEEAAKRRFLAVRGE